MVFIPLSERPLLVQMSIMIKKSIRNRLRALSEKTHIPQRRYVEDWLDEGLSKEEEGNE